MVIKVYFLLPMTNTRSHAYTPRKNPAPPETPALPARRGGWRGFQSPTYQQGKVFGNANPI